MRAKSKTKLKWEAHSTWADFANRYSGSKNIIHWIKKKSPLTDIQPSPNSEPRCVWLAVAERVQPELRWVRGGFLPSAADALRHCITSFKCYIMLSQHTHTRLTRTDTQARGWSGPTADVSFVIVSASSVSGLLQSDACFGASCIMCLNIIRRCEFCALPRIEDDNNGEWNVSWELIY